MIAESTEPGTIYRTGRPTERDYDQAIEDLRSARDQLEPDGRGCVVCWGDDHQAFGCHHNPLVMARRAVASVHVWRCYQCGAYFTDAELAEEHFGLSEHEPPQCIKQLVARQQELLLTIRNLSTEAIDPAEAAELRSQIAVLIAEIGTLRSMLRLQKEED